MFPLLRLAKIDPTDDCVEGSLSKLIPFNWNFGEVYRPLQSINQIENSRSAYI